MSSFFRYRRRLAAALAVGGLMALGACQNHLTDSLLEATDPDLINPGNLDTPEGADALRTGALFRFTVITGGFGTLGDPSPWLFSGEVADEYTSTTTFVENNDADQRTIKDDNGVMLPLFRNVNRSRTAANQAIAALTKWRPTQTANIAEMYFTRGFSELQLALDYCNGIPLSDASGDVLIPGTPLTGKEVSERALASFDSAVALATGTDTRSVLIANAARVGRGRALINLARFPEAATAVTGVPTSFSYNNTYLQVSSDNMNWTYTNNNFRYSLGDSAEGNARNITVPNALPFFSAGDPRISGTYTITPKTGGGADTLKAQDGQTFFRGNKLYATRETPSVVVSGVDARLIEAEAQLRDGLLTTMLATLNDLRSAPRNLGGITTPVMTPIVPAAPLTPASARDLFFREKAFWTFGRGQRLGDLRRLMRQYGLPQEQVFPVGPFFKGGNYGTDVNLPIPQAEFNNTNFTGCIDRAP